ncbi:MAG: hypothetical protein GY936_10550 [Ignavibacteriae bacterium]|nr:hypothetical protein [Ignavibacteriota bacterium]
MFKNEIKFLAELSVSKLNNKNRFFTLADIKKSEIHPAIIKYIAAHVERQIFLDVNNLDKNSSFDYSSSKVSKYLQLISEDIKSNEKFSIEEITKLIIKAIVFNINFLTRPNKTLTEFIFRESNSNNINAITKDLMFVYYYRFLPKILLGYLTKKKIKAISKIEFGNLLRKIDAIAKKNHLQGTINTAVDSMANFFDMGSEKSEKVPVLAVDFFLREKGLKKYSEKLNERFSDDESTMYLSLNIKEILRNPEKNEKPIIDKKVDEDIAKKEPIVKNKIDVENEIIDVDVDEEQIPNEELLSNENDLQPNEKEISTSEETIEPKTEENESTKEIIPEVTPIFDDREDIYQANKVPTETQNIIEETNKESTEILLDTSNIVVANEKIETLEELTIEDSDTVKPDAKAAIKELIDIASFYSSLSREPRPSENEILETKVSEESNLTNSKTTDYKIDISDLDTEFNIPEEQEKNIEDIEFQSVYDSDIEQLEDSEIDLDKFEQSEKTEKVQDISFENEDLDQHNEEPIIDNTLDSETSLDNDMTLSEDNGEEMSEVFSDITYLEKEEVENVIEEETEIPIVEEKVEDETESISDLNNFDLENNELFEKNDDNTIVDASTDTQTSATTKSFTEVVAESDMSTIIETIFDYDMEEYHNMIMNLANTQSETSAIQLVNKYCVQNNIKLSMVDVTSFKTLITNYFTQIEA